MRSVYLLCAVIVLGLIAHILLAASIPPDHALPFFSNYTVEHAYIIWWLYLAPPFAVAAIALLIWKSWMETTPRETKIGGWISVVVAAAINLSMVFEIVSGRL
ncbi:MAG TPA: hypothetical protein VJN21_10335 [Candidatus Acidoferrales bacterium]|nr:hypothetical protein [Candidatus Acidoferrales bacterium]